MPNFMGRDGFIWFQGCVEDRHDPLYLGRCKIRIVGWHTEDKSDMPTESLPWAYPLQPITSAAQTGVGISPTGPVEGTWVIGFFRDGEEGQDPVFFGTLGGIPETPANSSEGFFDPRGEFPEVHPDAKKKPDAPVNKLNFNIDDPTDNVPYPPSNLEFSKTKLTANTGNEKILSNRLGVSGTPIFYAKLEEEMNRSTYPRIEDLDQPTTPKLARGIHGQTETDLASNIVSKKAKLRNSLGSLGFTTAEEKTGFNTTVTPPRSFEFRDSWFQPDPQQVYRAKYPYNHVHQSESGHVMEVDDTPGFERLHRYHRTGTFEEIGSLGQRITKVVNESFHVGLNNDYSAILGNKYENIAGKLDVVSSKGYYHECKSGIFNFRSSQGFIFDRGAAGVISLTDAGVVIDAGGGPITLRGSTFNKQFLDGSQTDETRGNYTQKTGGSHTMETGSISMTSRGTAQIGSGGDVTILAAGALEETITNFSIPPSLTARSTTATFGDIKFNTALFGLGSFKVDIGPLGALSSISATPTGSIELKSLFGLGGAISIGATGVEISYLGGLSSISVGPSGVSISGLSISIGGSTTLTTSVEGVLTSVKGTGITTVEGALVKLN